jgi:PAS domain S-box-containing protein
MKVRQRLVVIIAISIAVLTPLAGFFMPAVPLFFNVLCVVSAIIGSLLLIQLIVTSIREATENKRYVYETLQTKFSNDHGPFDRFDIKKLASDLTRACAYINKIGDGELDSASFAGFENGATEDNDTLVAAILNMKSKLAIVAEKERQRNWISLGIGEFSQMFRDASVSFQQSLDQFIARLVKHINANQAGIFVATSVEGEIQLELKSCYAYSRKKYIERTFRPGEGLVGQTFLDGSVTYLKEIPKDYVAITSGLGAALPRCVVLIPIRYNDTTQGVLEIASFDEFQKHQLDFLSEVASILGATISHLKSSEDTKALLDASQLQAMQLKAQEEELKQNLEELNSAQEAIERKSKEAYEQNIKLTAVLDSTADTIITMNSDGMIETVNKAGMTLLGYRQDEMAESPFASLLKDKFEHGWKSLKSNIGRVIKTEVKNGANNFVPVEIVISKSMLGEIELYTAVLTNISVRVKAEHDQLQYIEELRAQEEELRQNMEELSSTQEEIHRQMQEISKINSELDARVAALNTSTIMSESDLYGTILFVNDKFLEVSQYSREELMGKPHKLLRHSDMPSEVFRQMWATIKAGKVFRGIVKNRKKDGTHYWVDAVISPVLDENGKPIKYIGVRYVIEDEELAQKLFNRQLSDLGLTNLSGLGTKIFYSVN